MKILQTHDLRNPLNLMIPTYHDDGEGGVMLTWTQGPIIWAYIESLKGSPHEDVMNLPPSFYRVVLRSHTVLPSRIRFLWCYGEQKRYLFARTAPRSIHSERFLEIIMEETSHEQNCP